MDAFITDTSWDASNFARMLNCLEAVEFVEANALSCCAILFDEIVLVEPGLLLV